MRVPSRRLFASVLLLGLVWPTLAEEPPRLTALLLTARAELPDPNFRDSVVLVMNHIGPTPMGVILNRPTRIDVWRLFPDLDRLMQLEDKVYFGGPVAVTSVSFLLRADTSPGEQAVRILDGLYLSTSVELLQKLLTRDKPMEGLRIFIGYSAWAPGQLEEEIRRRDWMLAPADIDSIFKAHREQPWPAEPPQDATRS